MEKRKMRIVILASGSRGDIQPCLALAVHLKNVGYSVKFATPEILRSFVESYGVDYCFIRGDPGIFLKDQQCRNDLIERKNFKILKRLREEQYSSEAFDDYYRACEGSDIIVCYFLLLVLVNVIAEKLKIPIVPIIYQPQFTTGEFPNFMISTRSLYFRFLNSFSYFIGRKAQYFLESAQFNKILSSKGYPPLSYDSWDRLNSLNTICSFDRYILPGEKIPHDWPQCAVLTGFLFLPPTSLKPLTSELQNWMNESLAYKPIYVGFGSMPSKNPLEFLEMIKEIVYTFRIRALYYKGWSGITAEEEEKIKQSDIEKRIFILNDASHDLLFPLCSIIIHHGGIGTTTTALKSCTPQIICPHIADQPFCAYRVWQLGVSPEPLPVHQITKEAFSNRIECVLNSAEMSANAKRIADDIVTNGVENAEKVIEDEFARYHKT